LPFARMADRAGPAPIPNAAATKLLVTKSRRFMNLRLRTFAIGTDYGRKLYG
jgi:hypothetical protein